MSNQPYAISVNGVQLANTEVKVTLPGTVKIKGSTTEWKNLLVQALGTSHTRVVLADTVDMDLTGYSGILITKGVTFTSEAPRLASPAFGPFDDVMYRPPARDARHLGPRLYTRSRAHPLFEIKCFSQHGENGAGDNVRINGFRLHGPDIGTQVGSDYKDRGIMIIGCKGIEIANMELAGWSGQAIYVQDLEDLPWPGRIYNPDDVKIHDNFFHHNQQKTGGEGYGVEVKHGAYALIERNVFDFNRHAIAAGGEDGTGYTARLNLVLKGGGIHNWDSHGIIGWFTHQFDVHGTDHCWVPDWIKDDLYNCGQAGEHFEFTYNAFQYSKGNAIKVRGKPTDVALVENNVFAHGSVDEAIGGGAGFGDNLYSFEEKDNVFGVDTYGQYRVCDIDGDGKDDLFLATGVNWWYASAGKMHWTYLKEATERLDQIGLVDFDGDGRCDVLTESGGQWLMASGGTGDWVNIGAFGAPLSEVRFGQFDPNIQDHRPGVTRRLTHAFRRLSDGQWQVTPLSAPAWENVQSSSFPMSKLQFGDFTGDGVTDVLGVDGERWAISESARGNWQQLNPNLGDNVASLLIADLDNNNFDDILRYRVISTVYGSGTTVSQLPPEIGIWEVSWDGRSDWTELKALTWTSSLGDPRRATKVFGLVGRFRNAVGADLLSVDYTRMGQVYDLAGNKFLGHSLYAY